MSTTLLPHQLEALRALAKDPASPVESGTLGFLRRRKLVGKVVGRDKWGQKTTSPITDAGRALLGVATDYAGRTESERITIERAAAREAQAPASLESER